MELLLTAPREMTIASLDRLARTVGFGVVWFAFSIAFLVASPFLAARTPQAKTAGRFALGALGFVFSKKVRANVKRRAAKKLADWLF